jgi:hypothetical protein
VLDFEACNALDADWSLRFAEANEAMAVRVRHLEGCRGLAEVAAAWSSNRRRSNSRGAPKPSSMIQTATSSCFSQRAADRGSQRQPARPVGVQGATGWARFGDYTGGASEGLRPERCWPRG